MDGFSSSLADHLSGYLALRRSLGYELRSQVSLFRQFDRVIAREMPGPGPVTRALVEAYLRSLAHLQPLTRRVRLSMIRQFLRYLRQVEPATFVPDRSLEPARSAPRSPYIFTDDEVRALVRTASRYPLRYGCQRWLLYPTLFGLLYVTGMRISEALALTLGDVDLDRAVLRIRRTKFHKARLIPLAASTCAAVRQYLVARAERGHPTTPEAFLFIGPRQPRLPYSNVRTAFHTITRMAGIGPPRGGRPPRIHDLRHTAAVRRLVLWYREGKNVQALLPALVTYLGHSSVRGTALYLTTTAELLTEASRRFEQAFDLGAAPRQGGLR
jgi:integrase